MTIFIEAAERSESMVLGLDVGQQQDYSALAAVARVVDPINDFDRKTGKQLTEVRFEVRGLWRFELSTPFSRVVAFTVAVRSELSRQVSRRVNHRTERTWLKPDIALDSTGIGAPLVEMFRKDHNVSVVPVVLTGGDIPHHGAGRWQVPKKDLIAALSVGIEQHSVKIASGLDLADDLAGELKNFRMQTNAATGRTTMDAKLRHHDDLLIAVALGLWWYGECHRYRQYQTKLHGL